MYRQIMNHSTSFSLTFTLIKTKFLLWRVGIETAIVNWFFHSDPMIPAEVIGWEKRQKKRVLNENNIHWKPKPVASFFINMIPTKSFQGSLFHVFRWVQSIFIQKICVFYFLLFAFLLYLIASWMSIYI